MEEIMRQDKQKNKQENEYLISIITKKYEDELDQKNKEIARLKEEVEVLRSGQRHLASKKASISNALVAAVDKAKEIEDSSKKVYELKINQLSALQARWEKLLEEMLAKYPNLVETENVSHMVQKFKQSMIEIMSEDFDIPKTQKTVATSGDQIRSLLSRVNKTEKKQVVKIERKKKQPQKSVEKVVRAFGEEKPTLIKPIVNMTMNKDEGYETLADKFLSVDEEEESAGLNKAVYSKVEKDDPYAYPDVNESGFNLEEAVNPKDDLEEIMKSFDFYEN